MIHVLYFPRYLYERHGYGLAVTSYRDWLRYDYAELLKRITLRNCDSMYFTFRPEMLNA